MGTLKKNTKRLSALCLAATVVGSSVDWTSVRAETQYAKPSDKIIAANQNADVQSDIILDDEDLPSNDELFEGYLERLFYGSTSTYSLDFGTSGLSSLNETEKKVYTALKSLITEVADGERESTVFYLCMKDTVIDGKEYKKNIDLDFSQDFSWETGGLQAAFDEAYDKVSAAIAQELDYQKVVRALLSDCPYELYWYLKTEGYTYSKRTFEELNQENKTGTVNLEYLKLSFTVAADYAKENETYLVDSTQVQRAKTAKANADKIVEKYAALDDYNKLKSYLKEICELNVYNTNAAGSSGTLVMDPWQLVFVFDGDTTTNVVCEGYSKAFAYLCEKSKFQNDNIKCYVVTGTLKGGTGAGGHMWNIVTMEDGKNYIVDVTNCDGNSVGSPDKLFLAGLQGTVEGGYVFVRDDNQQTATFTYDDFATMVYPESILTLASESYKPKEAGTIENSTYSQSYSYGNAIPQPAKENFTTNNNDSDAVWSFQWYEGDKTEGDLDSLTPLASIPKNAGTYTLAAKVTGAGFTPAETRVLVTITKKKITLNAKNAERSYGEANPEFTYELADGQTLAAGDELSGLGIKLKTTAVKDSEPGEYDIVLDTAGNTNYDVSVIKGTLTINKKEAISLPEEQRNYSYITGSGNNAVTIDIASKLPEDIGTAKYSVSVNGTDSAIIDSPSVSTDGKLTYKVPAAGDSTAVGKKAVIIVTIASSHYEDFPYKVNVELTDKIQVTSKDPVKLVSNTLVYGEKLSSLSFAKAEFVEEGTGNKVEGSLTFKEPDTVPEAGTTSAEWVFTPANTAYDVVYGSVSIVVNRAPVTISNKEYTDTYTYTGNAIQEPAEEQFTVTGGLSSPEIHFSWYDDKANLMKEIPSAVGEYVLHVMVPESKNYSEGILEVPVSIKSYSCADAVLDSEYQGSNNWYHGDVTLVPPTGHMISTDKKTWESKLVISGEHTGNVNYYLKEEKTGYLSDQKQIAVNIDTIAPTGSIKIADKIWNKFLSLISFGFYTKTEEIVTIKAEDAASGMTGGKIEYLITDKSYAGSDGLESLSKLPESDWTTYSAETKIKKNAANIIYAKLTDQAGNITYLSTDKILHDDIQPEITVSVEGTKYTDSIGSKAYDGSVAYTVSVKEENSLLKSLQYKLDGAAAVDLKDKETITVTTCGIHVLEIIAEDNAGNQKIITETFRIYSDFDFRFEGSSSIYDGQPIELGTDFSTVTSVSSDLISFSYSAASAAGAEDKVEGLPVDAGNYLIYAEIAEDTENCYKPQSTVMEYTINPKKVSPLDQTLYITKNLAVNYEFDAADMIPEVKKEDTIVYNIVSVSGSGIITDTPELKGSILTVPVGAVDSEENTATIEISFSNPNYIFTNAVLTLVPTEKEIVQLTDITMPKTDVYNGEPFAYTGTPAWTTEDGEKVEVSKIIVLYESTDDAGYSSSEAPVNAGSYKVTISIDNADKNYIGTASAAFEITKKTAKVTVKDKHIVVGDAIPSLEDLKEETDYTIEGLVSGGAVVGTLKFGYTDESGKEVNPNNAAAGTYLIAASGLENPNYDFVYTAGKLVIEAKPSSSGGNLGGSSSGGSTVPPINTGTNLPENTNPPADTSITSPEDNKNTEIKSDGTVVKTEEQTALDGTKKKTVTETRTDGTKTETITETNAAGIVLKERVTETAADGSAVATTKTTITNSLGTEVSKVTVETITANGSVAQTTEESAFDSENAKTVVTTVKDSSGSIKEASAHISKQGEITSTGKTKFVLSNAVASQITEAAGTDDVTIVVSVTDTMDRQLYSLTLNKKKLVSGNSLYLYGYDEATKTYTMINAVEYKVTDEQGLTIKASAGKNYTMLDKAEMTRVSKQIIKTVKLAASQKTKKSGKSFKVVLSKKANKASIKKIVYTTSNKKVVTVTKKGKVKTKAKGTAKVKAKVTMKNGKSKTLVLKVKVKK